MGRRYTPDDSPYAPGSEDYEYDRARQARDDHEDELDEQRKERVAMIDEAFKVHHGLPVVRAFSDMDLAPHILTIRVIDAVFRQILEDQ